MRQQQPAIEVPRECEFTPPGENKPRRGYFSTMTNAVQDGQILAVIEDGTTGEMFTVPVNRTKWVESTKAMVEIQMAQMQAAREEMQQQAGSGLVVPRGVGMRPPPR